MAETYEKLVQLKQEEKIGWLDFVLRGENSDDFKQWCEDHGTKPCEDAAEFYVDMTDRNMFDHQILEDGDNEEWY
jgi:hypothetical protein